MPWVLLENVEGMLDRSGDDAPVVQHVAHTLECLGYMSWAHRIVDTAGGLLAVATCHNLCITHTARLTITTVESSMLSQTCQTLGAHQEGAWKACHLTCHHEQPEMGMLHAGFGIPHRRRRVLLVASYWGDARDVLLTQVLTRD